MISQQVEKNIKNLERLKSVFENLQKCKTDKIIQSLLDFGELRIYENFNGITITLVAHSKTLMQGNQKRKFHITNFQNHKEKIKNEILPVLKCMLTEIKVNIEKKIKELNTLLLIQNKKAKK
jgi:hypothetical protein